MNRTQNAIRNMAWGMVQKCITLFIPFITRTVIIKVLGGEYIGLDGLFISVLNLLNLAELGVSNAIISNMYKPIADNDTDTICALMGFYRKVYHIVGVVILVLGIILLPFLRFLIKGDAPSDMNITCLYLIYLLNTSITYFLFAYKNCLYIAHQRNDINSKIQTICVLCQNIVQIVLVVVFHNYYLFAVVIPVFTVFNNLLVAHMVDKDYPDYVCKGELDKKILEEIKRKVTGLMLAKISSTIRSSLDSLFISAFLGLQYIAMYTNYFYIVTAVAGVIQLLETSLVAGVGDSLVRDTVGKNYNDYNRFTFMLQWIVSWSAVCILCLIQPFVQLWLGEEYLLNKWMPILCALYLFVFCICIIRSVYTQALGIWWSLRFLSIIDVSVNAVLNFLLIMKFGVYGILAATIIDIACVSIPWTTYFLFRDYFGLNKLMKHMKDIMKYFICFVISATMTYVLCDLIKVNNNIGILIVRGIICIIVPNIIYLILYNKNEYIEDAILFAKRHVKFGLYNK